MGRRKKGRPIHGWVNVDKPQGLSSAQVVARVRRALDAQKAGHGGTLDPLATGILPIALGEATKTVGFVMDGRKAYRCWLKFGAATTTDDAEGEVTQTSDMRPTDAEIEAALPHFTGQIEQIPPAHSAIKVAGQRAYKRARAGEDVDMPTRIVTIHAVTVVERPDADTVVLDVECEKGTYIRALARDIAVRLGTCGHVAALRRTRAGAFTEKDAISLDSLDSLGHSARLEDVVLPLKTALDDIPALALTEDEAKRLRHGQAVAASIVLNRTPDVEVSPGETVVAMSEDVPLALARVEDGEIRPVRVLNL